MSSLNQIAPPLERARHPIAARLRGALRAPQLLLALAALVWAGNFLVGRLLKQEITPVGLSFWRWALALLILLPWSAGAFRRQWRLILAEWKLIAALGATGIAVYNIFVYQALRVTTAVNAALFLATLPLLIALAGWLINGERLRRAQLVGMALSLLGAAAIVARGDLAALRELRFNHGDLWMLAAVPIWAVYAALQKRRHPELAPLTTVTASLVVAVILLLPAYLWEYAHGVRTALTAGNLLGVLYVAAGPSALGYALWNSGAARLGPARAGVYLNLIPLFSALLAVALLGETFGLYHLLGAALIAAGVLLSSRSPARMG